MSKNTTYSLLTSSLTLGAALAMTLTGCVTSGDDSNDTSADKAEYLFGLSHDEMLQVHTVAPADVGIDQWLATNRAPFRCAEFGTLCDDVGEDAAYGIIEDGYLLALDGANAAEVTAHQLQAIAAAEEVWAFVQDNDVSFKTTSTRYYYDSGSNNKRLKVVAKAVKLWPSGDYKASGDCRTQKKTLGVWGSMNSDSISGSRAATFGGSNGYTNTSNKSVSQDNLITFPSKTDTAASLRTIVDCTGTDGGWSASGDAEAFKS